MGGGKFISSAFLRALERRGARATASPLASPKIGIKLFFVPGARPDAKDVVPLFQRWIREDTLAPEQMIDVVRYRHVKEGPSVMLIGTASHYAIDSTDGRMGIRYSRRRPAKGTTGERIRSAFACAFNAARLFERETAYGFQTDEVELTIDDRLRAPNTQQTFVQVATELRSFALLLFEGAEIEPVSATSPKHQFRVRILAGHRRSLDDLIDRLDALRARALLMS